MGKYLTLTEETDYYLISCDGYQLRVYRETQTSNNYWGRLYNVANTTDMGNLYSSVRMSGESEAALAYDASRTVTVQENKKTRVRILISGNFYISGTGYANNSNSAKLLLTILPDRFFASLVWDTDGGAMQNSTGNIVHGIYTTDSRVTSEAAIYEDSGSEDAGSVNNTTAKYTGYTSDELNIILIDMYHTNSSNFSAYSQAATIHALRWNAGTMTDDSHHFVCCYLIDSAEREGSAKLYDSSDRLEQGIQYTNPRAVEEYNPDVLFYLDFEGADETERCTDKVNSIAASTIDGVTTTSEYIAGVRGYDTGGSNNQLIYPVTTHNIFNPDRGTLAFWWQMPTYTAGDYIFYAYADSSNSISIVTSGTSIIAIVRAGGVSESLVGTTTITSGEWYFIELIWEQSSTCSLFINSILQEKEDIIGTWAGNVTEIMFGIEYDNSSGCDCFLDQVFITNDPDSTNLYKPTTGEWVSDNAIAKYEGAGFSKDGAYHITPEYD